MMKKLAFTALCAVFFLVDGFSQPTASSSIPSEEVQNKSNSGGIHIAFYNVENLFDTIDQPEVDDSEFMPNADKNWNSWKYHTKLTRIGQVLVGLGGETPPAIVGLAEVENRGVLEDLVGNRVLARAAYKIAHFESPDRRGIDVALLYREAEFKLVHARAHALLLSGEPDFRSRDILHAKGILRSGDTLHVFVNHWPSRYGGKEQSAYKRQAASQLLKSLVDSISSVTPGALIVAMGDFNDHPSDESLLNLTGDDTNNLVNLMQGELNYEGSHRYRGEWAYLDQILISKSLRNPAKKKAVQAGVAKVYNHELLLEKDDRYPGEMPFRTYFGPTYHNGYSDHLPVYLELNY